MGRLDPLREAPGEAALLFDVDGTLAPIAPLPELARVPSETRNELRRLAERYLLVACISGRPGPEAAALVGVESIRYVGNHGLELDERAPEFAQRIAAFRDTVELPAEDKGLSLSYHFRSASDEEAARVGLEGVAERARAAGLEPRWGRKVLEIRPAVSTNKGTAVSALLAGVPARRALYAGDDSTDLDAFSGLTDAGLEYAVRIAVSSDEGPEQLVAAADLVVSGPAELAALLAEL